MNIFEKLLAIQQELKAPKGQYNSFGKYSYRSCEDILEAVKPICAKYNCALVLSDTIIYLGDRYYIQATARLTDCECKQEKEDTCITNTAYAREEETKKGMDGSQITGTASSYARKYALNGLFCIDDTKDADTDEFKKQEQKADKQIDEAGINTIITYASKYADMRGGDEDELLTYYMKKYKVVELSDLTQSQGTAISKELLTLINRRKEQWKQ